MDVRNMILRGVVQLIDWTAGTVQLTGRGPKDVRNDIEHLGEYGFAAHPRKGAEHVSAAVGADPSLLLVLQIFDHRYRISLAEGEVAMYDDQGQKVHLTRTGVVIAAVAGAAYALTVAGKVNASGGFATNGAAGLGGTLVQTGPTGGTTTQTIKGGLVTGVAVVGGDAVWTPDP